MEVRRGQANSKKEKVVSKLVGRSDPLEDTDEEDDEDEAVVGTARSKKLTGTLR